jgi:hypothetical protein
MAGKLLRPAVPARAEALRIASGGSTRGGAWRALEAVGLLRPEPEAEHRDSGGTWKALESAGLVPRAPECGRRFRTVETKACSDCRGKGRTGAYSGDPDEWEDDAWTCGHCDSQGVVPEKSTDHDEPPSIEACVALASDPEGIARAEALALEAAAHVAEWNAFKHGGIVWRVGGPLQPSLRFCDELRIFSFISREHMGRFWNTPSLEALSARRYDVGVGAFYELSHSHAELDLFWRTAASRGDVLRPAYPGRSDDEVLRPPERFVGRAFSDVPNPIDPMLAIWELGYVPMRLSPDAIELLVPVTKQPKR